MYLYRKKEKQELEFANKSPEEQKRDQLENIGFVIGMILIDSAIIAVT